MFDLSLSVITLIQSMAINRARVGVGGVGMGATEGQHEDGSSNAYRQLSTPSEVLMKPFWLWNLSSSTQVYMEAPVCRRGGSMWSL